jgi:hypothetical protein
MGRGLGKTNMSIEELKEAKRERDANRYALNKKAITKTNYHLAKNAISITCGCGGHYKDLTKNKNSHELTPKHSLWETEQRLQIHKLIIKKDTVCNTIEDANIKLLSIYEVNDKYKTTERERFLPSLVITLNKMEDKKVKKKIKLKLINPK